MNEETVAWAGGDLVGIVTYPAAAASISPTAFVLLGAGLLHSVGPNRLYVQIARRLAAHGAAVLRFDARGVGDSAASQRKADIAYDRRTEVEGATALLAARFGIKRFAFIGICSGATIAFRTALEEQRTVGVALANMDVGGFDARLDQFIAARHTTRYYSKVALFQPASWRRLLSGRSNYLKIVRSIVAGPLRLSSPAAADAPWVSQLVADLDALARRQVALLIVTGEIDPSADYVDMLRNATSTSRLAGIANLHLVRGGDHTFTLKAHQAELLTLLESWAARIMAQART